MAFFGPDPLMSLKVAAAIVALMTILSILFRNKLTNAERILFFSLIAVPVLLATLYMAAHTVHKNIVSETGGPVHWHVDYQVWVCGERLDLIDPRGLRNKIGTPLLHEHNDDRIHVEGTVLTRSDVSLGQYFNVIGGQLTDSILVYPTEDRGIVEVKSGTACNGVPASLRVYVNGERIDDPAPYVPAPYVLVPPGDCIIVEFSPTESQRTDRICESWRAEGWTYDNYREKRGDASGD